jgi:hypothetical protein
VKREGVNRGGRRDDWTLPYSRGTISFSAQERKEGKK